VPRVFEVRAGDRRIEKRETHIVNSISGNPVKALKEYQESIHHSESSREIVPVRQLVVQSPIEMFNG